MNATEINLTTFTNTKHQIDNESHQFNQIKTTGHHFECKTFENRYKQNVDVE